MSMKRFLLIVFLSLATVIVLVPSLIVWGGRSELSHPANPGDREAESETEEEDFSPGQPLGGPLIKIYFVEEDRVVEMGLEDYLVGVVAAEMPASFPLEALKAQAVAARTYVMQKYRAYGGPGCQKGNGADICIDSTHCQAWISREKMLSQWDREKQAEYYEAVYRSVAETRGEIIAVDGFPVEALYHSTCGGQTEEGDSLWEGSGFSYLKNVVCDHCKNSPHYLLERKFTWEEVALALEVELTLPVTAGSENVISLKEMSPGGRVARVDAGGNIFSGLELREKLGLPSTFLQWEETDKEIHFFIRGNGHGVGMCQYGAAGLARKGFGYEEIIMFYYDGVEIHRWNGAVRGE